LEVEGVIVVAAFVGTLAVKDTDAFVAVPLATYPAVTTGVIETVFVKIKVFVPDETEADVPETVDGPFADPLATAFVC
jgi:hypothetical protein